MTNVDKMNEDIALIENKIFDLQERILRAMDNFTDTKQMRKDGNDLCDLHDKKHELIRVRNGLPRVVDPIRVWTFEEAPVEYKRLSGHAGDEDWVAFVPDSYNYTPEWLEGNTPFGVCDVYQYKVEGGKVYIGAHS